MNEASPDDLRAKGWSVAVHNDYRIGGKRMTFWLLTHASGYWIKGEGETDAEALNQARKSDAVEIAAEYDATINSLAYA